MHNSTRPFRWYEATETHNTIGNYSKIYLARFFPLACFSRPFSRGSAFSLLFFIFVPFCFDFFSYFFFFFLFDFVRFLFQQIETERQLWQQRREMRVGTPCVDVCARTDAVLTAQITGVTFWKIEANDANNVNEMHPRRPFSFSPFFSTAAPPRALAPRKKQEKMQQNRTTKKESQRETTYTGSPLTRSIYPILNYERIFENARHLFPSRRRASIRPSLRWMNFMMKYRSGGSVSLFQGWLQIRSGNEYSHKCLIHYFSSHLNIFTFSTMHFIWFYRSIRAK